MTPTELRVEALRLSVATTGNSNKLQLAESYLTFLRAEMPSGEERPKGKQR